MVVGMKALALELGLPLVLLPQTYGPFLRAGSQEKASRVTRQASMAWARDADSHKILAELLGDDYSQDRHPIGVDMAFALAPRPRASLLDLLAAKRSADGPLVGVNISGLLVNSGSEGRRSLGIELNYPLLVQRVVTALVEAGAGHVFLVPHVLTPGSAPDPESDPQACQALLKILSPDVRSRVSMVPGPFSAVEIKAFISELDWFTGTRMHATIAALSTGVPTTALAYSAKFRGVFDLCGSQEQVIDLRTGSLEDCLKRALSGYDQRQTQKAILAERLPALKEDCANQMRRILACATSKDFRHVSP
jgi:polysaccharide pyruvyl transferase WcaK-like protein